jgi:hypothetical protein
LDPNLQKVHTEDPIEKSILRLTDGLDQIQQEQRFLRIREGAHRDCKFFNNFLLYSGRNNI